MLNEYKILGDTTIIYGTYRGEVFETRIDTKNLDKVSKACPARYGLQDNGWGKYYVRGTVQAAGKSKAVYLHRVILGEPQGLYVDHKDGDELNNLESNLRAITNAQNQQNRKASARNTSGIKGVHWHKRTGKWRGDIIVDGKSKEIGFWDNLEDAKVAMEQAYAELHPFSFSGRTDKS